MWNQKLRTVLTTDTNLLAFREGIREQMGGVTTTQSVLKYGQCDARFSPNSGFGLTLGDVLSATETRQDSL